MLRICDVSVSLGNLSVLDRVSFHVNEREIVVLIGPSGCGKSTILRAISGLVPMESGQINRNEGRLAFVFQDNRLLPWRTVYDNVRLVNEEEAPGEIDELLAAVGLRGFEGYYPSQLSGGMLKRCGIARAFFRHGQLLLMDEPFQGLDYPLRREMLSMLLQVWRSRPQGVVFVTHEIDEALSVASRILVMSKRPTRVIREFLLPGSEGRDPTREDLSSIRREIIEVITK
ncbi:MAG: ABC transporter ATP-binding protein [Dethiosulfovibrio peptidovorans]|nr:MAG: ABC transporter ATP-binding protein [Dethiosulfovibrio peptidovorans]